MAFWWSAVSHSIRQIKIVQIKIILDDKTRIKHALFPKL